MEEQRKYAILFAATILAARKLNDSRSTPWAIHVAIIDAIEKANHILEKIDERWPEAAHSRGLKVLVLEAAPRQATAMAVGISTSSSRPHEAVLRTSAAPVGDWPLRRRFEEVLKLVPNHMAPELGAQFRVMLTPVNLGIVVGTLTCASRKSRNI